EVLRGIGQHADPSSVAVLARDAFDGTDYASQGARILGLGRIRTVASLEALLGILALTNPAGERRVRGHLAEVRLSLMVLTGVDQGASPENWERWWRTNKAGFRVPAEFPTLPKDLRIQWDKYWGLPMVYARDER